MNFCPATVSGKQPLTFTLPRPAVSDCRLPAAPIVRNALHDAEVERHIASCTYLMEAAYARYEASGCFGDRGEADRWRLLRDEAVRSRSPAQVRRMELERGLA